MPTSALLFERLMRAIWDDKLLRVKQIVTSLAAGSAERAALLRGRNEDGHTPLCWAAEAGHAHICDYLLRANGRDGAADDIVLAESKSSGKTAFQWAVIHECAGPNTSAGFVDVFLRRVDAGDMSLAVLNHASSNGETPLHDAAMFDKTGAVVRKLLERGAWLSVNSRDAEGWRPLHAAALDCCDEVVRLLLAHGADGDLRKNDGKTPCDLSDDFVRPLWHRHVRSSLRYRLGRSLRAGHCADCDLHLAAEHDVEVNTLHRLL